MKARTLALAILVMGTLFVAAPIGLIVLNRALAWPRWQSGVTRTAGAVLLIAGIVVAIYCSQLFARIGEGTPVPIEPPRHLVLSGLYRYTRNPIYVADVAILFGLFLHRGELTLLAYTLAMTGALHAWIVWREEPELCRRFGEAYVRYMRSVPRWIGRGT